MKINILTVLAISFVLVGCEDKAQRDADYENGARSGLKTMEAILVDGKTVDEAILEHNARKAVYLHSK